MSGLTADQVAAVVVEVMQRMKVGTSPGHVGPSAESVRESVVAGGDECGVKLGVGVKEQERRVVQEVSGDDGIGDSGRVPDVGVASSWSDEMSEEASDRSVGSLEMVGSPSLSPDVRQVKFGGVQDYYPMAPLEETKSFYADYVRVARVKSFAKFVEALCGSRMPKRSMRDLALCTYSAGSVPDAFEAGKDRLRGLALVGDAWLTLHVVVLSVQMGKTAGSVSSVRSAGTSDKRLADVFSKKHMQKYIVTPSGIDLKTSKVSATMVEAMIGVVALYRDAGTVSKLITALGVVAISA